MSIWDVPLEKLQDSRLLALRMHVARFVVRTGATRPSVIALLDPTARVTQGPTLLELLEAAGAESPRLADLPASPHDSVPLADVLLIGEAGVDAKRVAERWRQADGHGAQVWAMTVDRLAGARDERIVESVDALIRIVIPQALGSNGTPPAEDIAVRLR